MKAHKPIRSHWSLFIRRLMMSLGLRRVRIWSLVSLAFSFWPRLPVSDVTAQSSPIMKYKLEVTAVNQNAALSLAAMCGWAGQSVAQQPVRGRSSRSQGQRAEVVAEFELRASLLSKGNVIGQSLRGHRQDSVLGLVKEVSRKHDKQCEIMADYLITAYRQ